VFNWFYAIAMWPQVAAGYGTPGKLYLEALEDPEDFSPSRLSIELSHGNSVFLDEHVSRKHRWMITADGHEMLVCEMRRIGSEGIGPSLKRKRPSIPNDQ
jgi:hypothetical protein